MLRTQTTGPAGSGTKTGRLTRTSLRLMTALGAAMLMLFLLAAVVDTQSVSAAGNAPVAQSAGVSQDGCSYGGYGGNPFMYGGFSNVYGSGLYGNFGNAYGGLYGHPFAPWHQPCVNVVTMSHCGSLYWGYSNCAPACSFYSCAPACAQNYSTYYGYYNNYYSTVSCVDRVDFVDPPLSVNCGSVWDLPVQVLDAWGRAVADGTTVSLATSHGSVNSSATTVGGRVNLRLTNAARAGLAQVTARAGNIEGQAIIMVRC